MTTPAWQPGTLYLPGALVVPRSTPAPQPVAIVNGDLEAGTTAWNFGGNVVLDTGFRFAGTNSLRVNGTGDTTLLNTTAAACTQGQVVKASCMYHQGSAGAGENTGRVLLQFLDAASAVLSTVQGNEITSSDGGWKKSSVTGVAPANTAFVKIGAFSHKTKSNEHQFDAFQWDVSSVTQGLLYKAVQAAAGTSDDAEPVWPSTLGVTVVDNTVTWEAVAIARIVWSPQAAMVSGATEPAWPTGMGTRVADGQVAWEAIPRRIEDENCPHSKVVVIASSKVYAADDDVVRYCATVNPYDWSTANDAGYLPYGLQQYGANPIAAMGLYRSNLVIFNAQAFQMWQVDEDPANSALLDALPIGSTWHKALAPVSNDLFFNSAQGVRTVSIAGGSTNLAAGDVGMPIDPLVQDAMAVATANSTKALATYVPSAGQYWLAFSDYPPQALAITGDVPDGIMGDAISGAYSASGGVLPYVSYAVTGGTFPTGLVLNADGTFSGSYTANGSFSWVVGVTDSAGNTATVEDTATVGVPTFGTLTAEITLPDAVESAYTQATATGMLAFTATQQVAASGTIATQQYSNALVAGTSGAITNAGDSYGDARLWPRGGAASGGWHLSADDNFGTMELCQSGAFRARLAPTSGSIADWWYFEQNTSPEFGGLVWFYGSSVYVGVRTTGSVPAAYNSVYRWPLAASGAVVPADRTASAVAVNTGDLFMHQDRNGIVRVIDKGAATLKTYDADLNLLSTQDVPVSLTGFRGFGVDSGLFVMVGADVATCYRLSDWSPQSAVTLSAAAIGYVTRVTFNDDAVFVQRGLQVASIGITRA